MFGAPAVRNGKTWITSAVSGMEADPSIVARARVRRVEQFAERRQDLGDLFVVGADASIQLGEFFHERLVLGRKAAERHKCANHEQAHLDGPGAVQDRRRHKRSVLGEGVGETALTAPAHV